MVDRDNNHDKVEVESWFIANNTQRDELMKNYKLPPFSKESQIFTVGSIVNKSDDINTDQTMNYFLFKITIGRAFVLKNNQPLP